MSEAWYRWKDNKLFLRLKILPRSKGNEYAGPHGDQFKVKILAPPVDGKANSHLIKMLAKDFGVTRNAVTLVKGESSRDKLVCIDSPTRMPIDLEMQE
ncbi:DUF167 family protein [Solemya velum gill symbiont]|uniref:UPF0235 protein BOV88_05375 n=1 Tax=Solemya velum gill symbiont TaxID=2340 RepID=A0A0B0HCD0_SOVGS|nr:DUF167 family protein [Solemya velum gill symbiont]KHF25534.1 hypothetical protein JV46_15100 [Solemya velum gill symbiont]OOY35366.1 YggU family protein [Solemya velum gill symbiont]OOY38043.1 YggU family protein [Solemya velum gill symbiont]OOY39385.1 YggU family protein [Solemya velum gill symbiont]OOY46604.1 YggU family protein [Solemya velum gill symbiont]